MEKFIKLILIIISLICTYIILAVGLKIVPTIYESSNSENINNVSLNLSYSYIAGVIFYFFVTLFPYLILKNKLKPALDLKLIDLKIQITSFIRSFNSVTDIDLKDIDLITIQNIIKKHSILDRSYYSPMTGTTMSNLDFLCSTKLNIFNLVESILTYREYLTSNQILELERIRDSKFFHLTKMAGFPLQDVFYKSDEFNQAFSNTFFEIIESARNI